MVKKVYCPRCGHVEKNLYLEETGGWFLCSHCHTQVAWVFKSIGQAVKKKKGG